MRFAERGLAADSSACLRAACVWNKVGVDQKLQHDLLSWIPGTERCTWCGVELGSAFADRHTTARLQWCGEFRVAGLGTQKTKRLVMGCVCWLRCMELVDAI